LVDSRKTNAPFVKETDPFALGNELAFFPQGRWVEADLQDPVELLGDRPDKRVGVNLGNPLELPAVETADLLTFLVR
jgi:hypothetical protein